MKLVSKLWVGATTAALFTGAAALAQVAGAVNGAVGATGAIPTPPPMPPSAAINGAAGAAGALNGMPAGMAGGLGAAANASDLAGANAAARAATAANAGTRSLSVAANQGIAASAALDMADTIRAINATSLKMRSDLLTDLHMRLDASVRAMAKLHRRAEALHGRAWADFKAAARDAHARERLVRRDLRVAARADADAWGDARAKLATDYSAYGKAVAHTETLASASGSAGMAQTPARSDRDDDHTTPSAGASVHAQGGASASASARS